MFRTDLGRPDRLTNYFGINAPLYREIGIKGFKAEGRKAFMQTWTSYYARAKLLGMPTPSWTR